METLLGMLLIVWHYAAWVPSTDQLLVHPQEPPLVQLPICYTTGMCCPQDPEGVLKLGFDRDVPPQNLKVDPYKYQFFKKKWPIHIPICSIWGQILNKITQFFQNFLKVKPILAQIWENFDKKLAHSYTKCFIL